MSDLFDGCGQSAPIETLEPGTEIVDRDGARWRIVDRIDDHVRTVAPPPSFVRWHIPIGTLVHSIQYERVRTNELMALRAESDAVGLFFASTYHGQESPSGDVIQFLLDAHNHTLEVHRG